MAGLSGCMHNCIRTHLPQEFQHAFAVADVQFVVLISLNQRSESLLIPAGVTLRSKEDGSLIVVDTMNLPALRREVETDLGPNESRRTGDEQFFMRISLIE